MNIALTCPASLPATQFGGILFLCIDIADELSSEGNNVVIYTTDLDFADNPKTFNKRLPTKESVNKFTIFRSHVWFSIGLFFVNPDMYFQMMRDDPDIIHAIGVRSFQAFVAAIVAKKKKIPFVISDQGGLTTHPDLSKNTLSKRILYRFQYPIIKFIINQATRIIVANEYEKKIFLQFCNESKIRVVRNGINLNKIKSSGISFKEKYGINESFVLFVGRFSKIKGIDILLHAIATIKNDNRLRDIQFVIMGADFGFEDEMMSMITQLDLEKKVVVIKRPPRTDVIAAYQECEFLVLPSRWELSPLTPLEGFVFKKAVISTTAHGIPHTLTNGKDSILVDPENYVALAKAIIQLVNDKERCRLLGHAGFELIRTQCNSKLMAASVLTVYQEIVKK